VFSGRELQILTHLATGESNKQIALGMGIADATVKVHVKTILRKLSLTNRTQAAIWAVSEGLVNRDIQHNRAMAA
jgi:two-component system nitrate/nitrite response regulator NarL